MRVSTVNNFITADLSKFATVMALFFLFFGLTSLMICIPVLNKCYAAAVICILFSGLKKDFAYLFNEKIIIVGFVFVLLLTVGVFYSQGSWHYALRNWNKYLKIFYLLFFIPLFQHKQSRTQAIFCFLVTVMFSEVCTYLHYFEILTFDFPPEKHWPFVQDIDAGFIVSFASFLFANLAVDRKKYRFFFILCFLICSVDLLILNQQRTGYLVYLALAGLFFWQRFSWKGLVSGCILIPVLFGALFMSSPKFSDRINQVISNVVDYQKGTQTTSIGLRLTFAEYSFRVIKKNWIFGSGTGSFEEIYRSLKGPKINNVAWPAHPHNEYISILFQLGLPGLLVFLYWMALQLQASFQLPREERTYLQGLWLGFILLGFCNASLLVNPAGACYMTLLAVFLAAKYQQRGDRCV